MAEVDAVKGEAASRTRVLREYLGDNGDELVLLSGEVVVYSEVEQRGAPKVAPSRREKSCPCSTLGEEEGDNAAEDLIGEAADEVEGRVVSATSTILACWRILQFGLVTPPLFGYGSLYIIHDDTYNSHFI